VLHHGNPKTEELKVWTGGATTISSDNQSSIKIVHNPVIHENTKHIDIHYHFVRELQEGILT
jgi:hypothetical protein